MTFEKVNNNIVFKLINKEKNLKMLEDVPHKDFIDLTVVFYVFLPGKSKSEEMTFALISNELLKEWKVTVDMLMECALENTPKILGLQIRGIMSTIASYMDDSELEDIMSNDIVEKLLFIATNNLASYGAGVILYKDMLKAFAARKKSDLYIIPCSVHETIIFPAEACKGLDISQLRDMIYKVNRENILEKDVLSDNLYYYSRNTEEITIV